MSTENEDCPPCNPHPDAPHGFDRNASHSLDRYVCECEGWAPPAQSDCPYGMSPGERAEFEKAWDCQLARDHAGHYIDGEVSNQATGWADCAKLNREKLAAALSKRDEAVELAFKIQDSNNALLARIKELEAAMARLDRGSVIVVKELEAENLRAREKLETADRTIERLRYLRGDEIERLQADAKRLDILGRAGPLSIRMLHDCPGDGDIFVAVEDTDECGQGPTLRAAIDDMESGV